MFHIPSCSRSAIYHIPRNVSDPTSSKSHVMFQIQFHPHSMSCFRSNFFHIPYHVSNLPCSTLTVRFQVCPIHILSHSSGLPFFISMMFQVHLFHIPCCVSDLPCSTSHACTCAPSSNPTLNSAPQKTETMTKPTQKTTLLTRNPRHQLKIPHLTTKRQGRQGRKRAPLRARGLPPRKKGKQLEIAPSPHRKQRRQ